MRAEVGLAARSQPLWKGSDHVGTHRNKLRFLFRRDHFDRKLAEEMDLHQQMFEVEKTQQGLAREAAAMSARRQLGNTALAWDYSKDVWIIAWLDTLVADVRYALRRIAANKTFSALAILSLALGIGANAAIFTLVGAVMLKSLPVASPKELYRLGNVENYCVTGGLQDSWALYSYTLYQQFRDHTPELGCVTDANPVSRERASFR